jgi:hypothetical protein
MDQHVENLNNSESLAKPNEWSLDTKLEFVSNNLLQAVEVGDLPPGIAFQAAQLLMEVPDTSIPLTQIAVDKVKISPHFLIDDLCRGSELALENRGESKSNFFGEEYYQLFLSVMKTRSEGGLPKFTSFGDCIQSFEQTLQKKYFENSEQSPIKHLQTPSALHNFFNIVKVYVYGRSLAEKISRDYMYGEMISFETEVEPVEKLITNLTEYVQHPTDSSALREAGNIVDTSTREKIKSHEPQLSDLKSSVQLRLPEYYTRKFSELTGNKIPELPEDDDPDYVQKFDEYYSFWFYELVALMQKQLDGSDPDTI